jgi:GT2 family glycosyltransferase
MDLSIIIVNWNARDFLLQAVHSVRVGITRLDYEIIVIDSASFDGSGDVLRRLYPEVIFLQSNHNRGFAQANNDAFAVAKGKTILFLNPDTQIQGDAITLMYSALRSLEYVGIVGPKLLNSDGSIQDTCVRAFPTILNQILDTRLLRRLLPTPRLWGVNQDMLESEHPVAVDAVSGACLMIKRELFERVGMFTAEYFMYSEDIELCLMAREAGLASCFVPKAVVFHHGGGRSARTSVSSFSAVMLLESRWRFFKRTRSNSYAKFYRLAMFLASAVRVVLVAAMLPAQTLRGERSACMFALRKWMARLMWTLGRQSWVKQY